MANGAVPEESRIAALAWPEINKMSRGQADLLGPAPGTTPVIGEAEVERWNTIAPEYQGIDAHQIAEERGLTPAGATLTKYPFRAMMLQSGTLQPIEQVRYAKEMERRSQQWRKRQGERGNERIQDIVLPPGMESPV